MKSGNEKKAKHDNEHRSIRDGQQKLCSLITGFHGFCPL